MTFCTIIFLLQINRIAQYFFRLSFYQPNCIKYKEQPELFFPFLRKIIS